jgi:hypothetical protein
MFAVSAAIKNKKKQLIKEAESLGTMGAEAILIATACIEILWA